MFTALSKSSIDDDSRRAQRMRDGVKTHTHTRDNWRSCMMSGLCTRWQAVITSSSVGSSITSTFSVVIIHAQQSHGIYRCCVYFVQRRSRRPKTNERRARARKNQCHYHHHHDDHHHPTTSTSPHNQQIKSRTYSMLCVHVRSSQLSIGSHTLLCSPQRWRRRRQR